MASPYKMKGHTLPGPNQKKSPMKLDPLTLTALAIAAAKGAAMAAGGTAITKGVGALSNKAKNKKEEKAADLEAKKQGLADQQSAMSGEIGTKTKIV